MSDQRALITFHLPLDMGFVADVLKVVTKAYPTAMVGNTTPGTGEMKVIADPDAIVFHDEVDDDL